MTEPVSDPRPPSHEVITHCRICASFCGLKVTVDRDANRVLRIAPDKDNPYTWRDFCAKGRTANEFVEHPRRILTPMRRIGDRYVEATWDEAITDIARRLNAIIAEHGPDAVGSYHGNPSALMLSTTMFFTGLLDAIGTSNRYWVGSVDQNNIHVVSQKLYGTPLISLISDVDECDCFLLIGTNPAVSGMHWVENVSDGWRRVLRAKDRGADLIIVDPRRTESAEHASTHVAIRPGTDWAFLLGVLKVVFDRGWARSDVVPPIVGLDHLQALTAAVTLDDLADRCGLSVATIGDVAERFATARTALCAARTGVSQTVNGTLGEWLSMVLNHVTGRVDVPGGRRYERGYVDAIGLWDRFAPPLGGRSRLRGLPAVAGFHSLSELPDEITTPGSGQIRAMLILSGNPVVSGPDGAALDNALSQLDLLVVVDMVQRESHRHADWLLPGTHWLERNELHALLSSIHDEPFVQYGHKAVDAPPGCREEWSLFVDLALAMKRPMFGKRGVNSFIRVSRLAARALRRPWVAFSPTWVERGLVRTGRRVRWKEIMARPHGWIYADKEYGNLARAVRTPDGAINLADEELLAALRAELATGQVDAPADRPFALVSRRRRDSMNSYLNEIPGLHRTTRTNVVEINSQEAARLGLTAGDQVRVFSSTNELVTTVVVSDAVREGVAVMEQGWGSRVFDPVAARAPEQFGANRNLLIDNQYTDPLSQVAGLNGTQVGIAPIA